MNIVEILELLHQSLHEIKACLEEDKLAFNQNNSLLVEQNNEKKLTINAVIENLLIQLQEHPERHQVNHFAIWQAINMLFFEIQNLIQINHQVVIANQRHLIAIFESLTQISSQANTPLYQKTGELA